MSRTKTRQWTAYANEDGDPWAIFMDGHIPLGDLKYKYAEVSEEMIAAFRHTIGEDCRAWFKDEPKLTHFWIRDTTKDDDPSLEPGDIEYPYRFCGFAAKGAMPVTGVKFE